MKIARNKTWSIGSTVHDEVQMVNEPESVKNGFDLEREVNYESIKNGRESRVVASLYEKELTLFDRSKEFPERKEEFEALQREVVKQYILHQFEEGLRKNCVDVASVVSSNSDSLKTLELTIRNFAEAKRNSTESKEKLVLHFEDDDSIAVLHFRNNGDFKIENADETIKSKIGSVLDSIGLKTIAASEEPKVLKLKEGEATPENYTGCVEYATGTKRWFVEGKRHKLDGPAVVYKDGTKSWWLENVDYPEAVWKKKVEELKNILPPATTGAKTVKGYDDDVYPVLGGETWRVNAETSFPVVRVKSWEKFKDSEQGKTFVGLVLQEASGRYSPPIRIQANCGKIEKLSKDWINIPTVSVFFDGCTQTFFTPAHVNDGGSVSCLSEHSFYEPIITNNGEPRWQTKGRKEHENATQDWIMGRETFLQAPVFDEDVRILKKDPSVKRFTYGGKAPWLVFEIENERVSGYSYNPTVITRSEVEIAREKFQKELEKAFPQEKKQLEEKKENLIAQELKQDMVTTASETTRTINDKVFQVKSVKNWTEEVEKVKFTGIVINSNKSEFTVVDGRIASLPGVLNYPVTKSISGNKEYTTGETGGRRFNMFGPSFVNSDKSKKFYLKKQYEMDSTSIPEESFYKKRNEFYGDTEIAVNAAEAPPFFPAFLLKLFPEKFVDLTGSSNKVVARLKFDPTTKQATVVAFDTENPGSNEILRRINYEYVNKTWSSWFNEAFESNALKTYTWDYVTPEMAMLQIMRQVFPEEIDQGISALQRFIHNKEPNWIVSSDHQNDFRGILLYLRNQMGNKGGVLTLDDCSTVIKVIDSYIEKQKSVNNSENVLKLKRGYSFPNDYTGCIEYENGIKEWLKKGILHRENGPAREFTDGEKQWIKEGKFHRLDGPAVERTNGTKAWYIEGKEYSEADWKKKVEELKNSPAVLKLKQGESVPRNYTGCVEYWDGTRKWFKEGFYHRLDGPAIEYENGTKCWFIKGSSYSEAEWKKEVAEIQGQNSVDKRVETQDSPNTQQTTKQEEKKQNMAEESSTKEVIKKTLTSDAKKAGIRVTCKKLSKAARSMLAEIIADKMKYKGKQKAGFVSSFSDFLMTPFGESLINGMIGSGIPLMKDKLPEKFQGPAMIVAEELRVSAMATAGEEVLDTLTPMLGMMTDILTSSFSSMALGEEEEEAPAERIRVEAGNPSAVLQELEATGASTGTAATRR